MKASARIAKRTSAEPAPKLASVPAGEGIAGKTKRVSKHEFIPDAQRTGMVLDAAYQIDKLLDALIARGRLRDDSVVVALALRGRALINSAVECLADENASLYEVHEVVFPPILRLADLAPERKR